ARVIARIASCTCAAVLTVNGDGAAYGTLGLPVVRDVAGDHAGPLAGLLSGMVWAGENAPAARCVVTAPCDTPFLPENYVPVLLAAKGDAETIVIAASGEREHYTCGLWPLSLKDDLAAWIAGGGHKMRDWIARHPHRTASFLFARYGAREIDPFFNINTPEDYALAQKLIEEKGS
ncbi:MAG: NTP transferase domain-containing protein, partial [Rhodomicrobium sp.]|nr:NTP transferase domain-containing protein [Rhodomicrobium sp.]